PVWWVAARVLAAADPAREARQAGNDLARDGTASVLADALPNDATVVALGWAEQIAEGLLRRGDVEALIVDCLDEGADLAGWLRRSGSDAEIVPESGSAAAVAASDLVLLEAVALGPTGLVATAGSAAAAAVARQLHVPVWVVAGEGRVLPESLWTALSARLADRTPAWDQAEEIVPLNWANFVVGPTGVVSPDDAVASRSAACPPAPELEKELPRG
ncbi:MAG: hypothetical protein ACRD2W_08185, partial [Acidimicrobiales bacterium]